MKSIFFSLVFSLILSVNALSQSKIIGIWKNIDDEDGKEKSHIEIYEHNGTLRAKVIKLLPAATVKTCTKCSGTNKNKDIEGMEILWDLKKKSDTEYEEGKILNPKNGKIYDCFISLESPNKLKVRGYMGISLMGKTQYWHKV